VPRSLPAAVLLALAAGPGLPSEVAVFLEGPSGIPEGTGGAIAITVAVLPEHGDDRLAGGSLRVDGGGGNSLVVSLPAGGDRSGFALPFAWQDNGIYTLTVTGSVGVRYREWSFLAWRDRYAEADVDASFAVGVVNVPPIITGITGSIEAVAGVPFGFAVEFRDPGGLDAVTVEWDLDGDGAADVRGPAGSWVFDAPGPRRAEVTVGDDDGGEARATIEVDVRAGAAAFRRGDLDGDGAAALTDAVVLLEHLFLGGPGAPACPATGDADDDGVLAITDAIAVLGHLFLGRPPPPEPFAACGLDPTPDGLGCREYPPCVIP